MTKKAIMSNVRDPENRSKKGCVCGGHSKKAKKKKKLIKNILGKGVTIMDKKKGNGKLAGKSFCFTGALGIKRAEAQQMVKNLGGECKSSVSKGLTYLVQADPDSESTKSKKAKKLGTKVIGEEEFLGMVE